MNVVLLHCKQYTRRGAFNFHNCSDINIHNNSTKTFKITYATYITAFYCSLCYWFLSHFLILVMSVLVKKNIVSVQGMR